MFEVSKKGKADSQRSRPGCWYLHQQGSTKQFTFKCISCQGRDEMILGGEIKIKGPGLTKRLAQDGEVFIKKDGVEFILNVSNSKEESVDFDIWTALDEEDIEISTSIDEESESVYRDFVINLRDSKEREIELTLSISQMKALAEIFQSYTTACDLLQRCKGRSIPAESD